MKRRAFEGSFSQFGGSFLYLPALNNKEELGFRV